MGNKLRSKLKTDNKKNRFKNFVFSKFENKKLLKIWPVLVIFLLVVIFAWPYLFQKMVPFASTFLVTWFAPWNAYFGMPVKNGAMPDVITQIYPWRKLVIEAFRQGQWPLWNPYSFSGTPLLANFQSASFHPLNWLFFILPQIEAWSLIVLAQPLLAALFTYLFCRQLKMSQMAALLSSFAFGFCGFIVCWMAYGTLAFSLLWLPLIFYALEKRKPVLISFGLAFSVFSGHFQISFYVILASLIYLLWRKRFKMLIFWLLGVLLAMPQILPSLEFYQQSFRKTLFGRGEVIPWQYLVTLLAPDFYGNAVTRNDWFGHYAEWAGFIGVIPLLLAVYAFWRRRSRLIWFFVFLALLSLSLALPTPLLDLLVRLRVPVLATSAASRIISLFSFGMAVLAGFGFDQLRKDWQKKGFLKSSFVFLIIFAALFLFLWFRLLFWPFLPADKILIAKRNLILPSGLFFVFGGLFLGIWFLDFLKTKFKKVKLKKSLVVKLFLIVILFLSAFDSLRFAKKWMPFDPREYVYPATPVTDFLISQVDSERVFGNLASESLVYFRLPGIEGYDALYPQRYGEFITTAGEGKIDNLSRSTVFINKNGLFTEKFLRLLGAKYLFHSRGDGQNIWAFPFWRYPGQFKLLHQDDRHEVYENLKSLPRAFLVYDYQVIESGQTIIDRLVAEDFEIEKTIILEEAPGEKKINLDNFESAKELELGKSQVKIISDTPNQIDLEVEAFQPGFLFLADNFYPGWQASVDNQGVKIYRADYTFRAIEVPQGKHQISFIFKPASFRLGLIISFFSLLTLLVIVLFFKKFIKKENF